MRAFAPIRGPPREIIMFVELKKPFLGRAAGERIDVSEDDARQLVQQGTAVAVADDLIGPAVSRALDAALARAGQSIDAAVNQSLKAFADAQTLARKHAVPALFGPGGEGDPHGKSFGDWCLAVARNDRDYLEKHYGSRFNECAGKAALAEACGVTGGYTVPPEFYQQLMTIMAEKTFIRPRAFVMPMAVGHHADPVPRRHHRAVGRRVAVLRRRADVLDRRGPDAHRDRAAVQADGAEGVGAVRLLGVEQRAVAGQRDRAGEVPDDAVRQGDRLVRGVRLPAGQRRRQAAGDARGRRRRSASPAATPTRSASPTSPGCGRSCCRSAGARPSGRARRRWCRSSCSSRTLTCPPACPSPRPTA